MEDPSHITHTTSMHRHRNDLLFPGGQFALLDIFWAPAIFLHKKS
jgi:hypothetical protein